MSPEVQNDDLLAKTAFSLMQRHRVAPIPENYAVWFHYAMGQNKDLVHEVDNVLNNRMAFTQETCSYLHNKFILGNRNQKVLDDAAINAQKVLLQVLKAINEFSSETQNYNKDVDHYLDDISHKFEDPDLKGIVKDLIAATTSIKQRGEEISGKLEESTQEINSLKKNLQKVTIEAQRDFLTGVFNRKTFEKTIPSTNRSWRPKSTILTCA
jgi:diguanylate cyclase